MKNDFHIRQAADSDYLQVFELLREAFKNDPNSDHNEALIVERLKSAEGFIPEYAMVADMQGKIVGYILLSSITIVEGNVVHKALALAPVAVLPAYQQMGIGSALINKVHEIASSHNEVLIVVIGHASYYPMFGYVEAAPRGIKVPFNIPSPYVMIKELKKDACSGIQGMVRYPPAFYL